MKNRLFALLLMCLGTFLWTCNRNGVGKAINDAVSSSSQKKVIILSIDGGGIKGIIPATFLSILEDRLNLPSYKVFNLIGGTSTGGIIALGLTCPVRGGQPYSAEAIAKIYEKRCNDIFVPTGSEGLEPYYYADMDSSGKHYGAEVFAKEILTPAMTLSQAAQNLTDKKVSQVFTTTYLLDSVGGTVSSPNMGTVFGPYLYNWYDAQRSAKDNYYTWEAARSTGAAPTYFPIAHVGGGQNGRSAAAEKWAIDGGVMSNDPAIWAIAEAFRTGIAQSMDDILLISLGCGLDKYSGGLAVTNPQAPPNPGKGQKYGFWGPLTWAAALPNLNGEMVKVPIAEIPLYANQFVPASQLDILAASTGMEYYRVQPPLLKNLTPMSDCNNTHVLASFAHRYFEGSGKAQLDDIVNAIRANL